MTTRTRIPKATAALWLLLAMTAAACADSHAGLIPNPLTAHLTTTISPDPSGGDPEPVYPISIHAFNADIQAPLYNGGTSPNASLRGSMTYDSYHARISAKASVTGPSTFAQDFFPQERNTFWAFWNQTLNAYWSMPLPDICGHRLRTEMKFEAWWIYSGGWSMDSEERFDDHEVEQRGCGEEEPAPGDGGKFGPGGGTGTLHCYTYSVDHYWYYPDTGEYEYRFTETKTWCEPAST